MKKAVFTIAIALTGFLGYGQGGIPVDLGGHNVNINISEAYELSEISTPEALSFSYADAAAINADAVAAKNQTLDIKANIPWKLTAYAGSNFTNGGEAELEKTIPLSVLKLNNTAIAIGESEAVTIKTGTAGISNNTQIIYDVTLGANKWTYAPTDYNTTVYLTFGAQ
jgi:hypothetical protein